MFVLWVDNRGWRWGSVDDNHDEQGSWVRLENFLRFFAFAVFSGQCSFVGVGVRGSRCFMAGSTWVDGEGVCVCVCVCDFGSRLRSVSESVIFVRTHVDGASHAVVCAYRLNAERVHCAHGCSPEGSLGGDKAFDPTWCARQK